MPITIGETIEQLHNSLADYIEATYHISDSVLVGLRRKLLHEYGVIHQRPFLESTPRYKTGKPFAELGLDSAALDIFSAVSAESEGLPLLLHDPPYQHQAAAVQKSLRDGRSLVVTTGTGSGKTECFLLPILGKLAQEASSKGEEFGRTSAMRALVLYPMNALVNDQLGRLRLLFADPRIVRRFTHWSGRPARFARYTSRTLYPGVRSADKDKDRLAAIGRYYVRNLETAAEAASDRQRVARALVDALKKRGKWPAKPDLLAWYGSKGSRWRDSKTGAFKRCVTLSEDPELLTRHEVHQAPPDVLVTNYSMLEYMLMRPLERPIFDQTSAWLDENPDETLLLVLDEAHLYRGAAGAEVALLVRRLRTRLGIAPERLRVICTSASFQDASYAAEFGAQLTGKDPADFDPVTGDLLLRDNAGQGSVDDAEALSSIDLDAFYGAETEEARLAAVGSFLEFRGVGRSTDLQCSLFEALNEFPPMGHLINLTMQEAQPVNALWRRIFEGVEPGIADMAVTVLIALGSLARREPSEPGLLPCRVHSFYRGLAGLWVCMDAECSELPAEMRGKGPAGKLYSQPRDECGCGARVLELYTCRNCGSAYARAYTDDVEEPDFLWGEAGGAFRTLSGTFDELEPLDLLLETPVVVDTEPAEYNLVTGRLNASALGARNRQVFIRKDRAVDAVGAEDGGHGRPGEFRPCGICGEGAASGRSSVQDHQTKGDQPFQALVTKQIQLQPPRPVVATRFAPLRGRKVLVFSDSRQIAARLAPNLQTYSTQDAMRPLLVAGFDRLQRSAALAPQLTLEDMYLAVLIAAEELGVRLRPELRADESFTEELTVRQAIGEGALEDDTKMLRLFRRIGQTEPPQSLLRAMTNCLTDRFYGLESLALASVVECEDHTDDIKGLPDIAGLATTDDEKLALVRAWIRCWRGPGFWLSRMPGALWLAPRSEGGVRPHSGSFNDLKRFITNQKARRAFDREWLPKLRQWFTERMSEKKYRLLGRELSLRIQRDWAYCQSCRTTQRPYPGKQTCINCGRDTAVVIDPNIDPVFSARKGYYRASTIDALGPSRVSPMAIIAAEHTAQLNAAQIDEVFSKAEEHELLFQDVNLGVDDDDRDRAAIDVLSCTTTMEVGIDIGSLSGVALRNMPPARANYQQRAGRAGRRGNAVATVVAFGSADSHDEHYFTNPDHMIRGAVDDPKLTMDNFEIARRHVTAFLLQRYHQERLPHIAPEEQPHLFDVLGTVENFKKRDQLLNREDLAKWLRDNEQSLKGEVSSWLPAELSEREKTHLLEHLIKETLRPIDDAIEYDAARQAEITVVESGSDYDVSDATSLETSEETGEERPGRDPAAESLLDRLLYKGVLPRYAFPTDIATFHVFDANESTLYRPVFQFAPSQGLPVALSQYAPGKEVWIGGKLWTSGAIYSPMRGDRYVAWQNRRLYYECSFCHYAHTVPLSQGSRGEKKDCETCGTIGTFGPARHWLRPPGFAHPVFKEEGTSPDDQPARSYATRAKLTAPTPVDEEKWWRLNPRIRVHYARQHLLVTNRGPREEGYTYCTKCGLIEPTAAPTGSVGAAHRKPFPQERDPDCPGGGATKGLVLGTDFITDVLLVSITVEPPLSLAPGFLATDVALRTLSEAITTAACSELGLEAQELQAEYRPALTLGGRKGLEAEIYLYDTLPGGAGFSRRVGELGLPVFEAALQLLDGCPDGCDRSCYRCLRSYKNKFEHDLLDRHLGASLLRFLLNGDAPLLDPLRLRRSTELLLEDLRRQELDDVAFEREQEIIVTGLGTVVAPILATRTDGERFVIGLHGPLTPDEPPTDPLRDLKEYSTTVPVILKDELVVRRNLPSATRDVIAQIR